LEVRITGRHAHLGAKVKEYAIQKLAPLSRFDGGTRSLEVVFDEDHLGRKVEVIAHMQRGKPLVATVQHKDALAAIDLAHDKLEKLLTRKKEKNRTLHRHPHGSAAPLTADPARVKGAKSSEEE
jgi:ribosomal subunit interface protein